MSNINNKLLGSINNIIGDDTHLMQEFEFEKKDNNWLFLEETLVSVMLNFKNDTTKSLETLLKFPNTISKVPDRFKREAFNDPIFINIINSAINISEENSQFYKTELMKVLTYLKRLKGRLFKFDNLEEYVKELLSRDIGMTKSIISTGDVSLEEDESLELCIIFNMYFYDAYSLLEAIKNHYNILNRPMNTVAIGLLLKYNFKLMGVDLLCPIGIILEDDSLYNEFYDVLLIILDTYISLDKLYIIKEIVSSNPEMQSRFNQLRNDYRATGLLKMII